MGVLFYFIGSFVIDRIFPRRRNPYVHFEFNTFDEQAWRSYAPPPPPRSDAKIAEAYSTLGVSPSATDDEVRAAYKRLARENHPDRFAAQGEEARRAAENRFKRIGEARDVIANSRGWK